MLLTVQAQENPRDTAFSILRRIVWNATRHLRRNSALAIRFQYPQTDRVECYHLVNDAKNLQRYDFQYPQTDRVECYFLDGGANAGGDLLSVSSDGSCGMLPDFSALADSDDVFQYPQTDRVECYFKHLAGEM